VAIAALLKIVDDSDVAVVQRGEELGLTFESGDAFRVTRQGFGKNLDGDIAFQFRVLRAIDFAHSPSVNRGENLEGIEPHAGRQGHRAHYPSAVDRRNGSRSG
jgi:hypothetical protein